MIIEQSVYCFFVVVFADENLYAPGVHIFFVFVVAHEDRCAKCVLFFL